MLTAGFAPDFGTSRWQLSMPNLQSISRGKKGGPVMATAAPPRVFADLAPAGLEMSVACQKCGHVGGRRPGAAPAQSAPGRPPLSLPAVRRDRPAITRHASSRRAPPEAEG